jgi:hypothetical protein
LPVADDAMESLIKQIASHDKQLTLQKIKVNMLNPVLEIRPIFTDFRLQLPLKKAPVTIK